MIDITAPIQEVTVYADRALILRRGTVALEAGEQSVRFNDLPLFLRDSLRASGRGPQGMRILNVDVTNAFYARPPEEDVRQLQDQIEELEQQKKLYHARLQALTDRRQWLRALGEQSQDFARGLAKGKMSAQDCADLFRVMSEQSIQDAENELQINQQIKHIQLEINARQRELNHKRGNHGSDRLAAIVGIEVAAACEIEVEVSYLAMNASWFPQYDVRVQMEEQTNSGNVELTYIGMVQQTTGETWENVKLALSTARPSLAAKLPELTPWYLAVQAPVPPPAPMMSALSASPPEATRRLRARMDFVGAAESKKESFLDDEDELAPPPAVAEIATAQVEQTGTAYVFHIGSSANIPSDNTPHKTTIAYDHIPCTFDYVSAPALEENVHLRATITNSSERTLLAGDANIFLSGDYVGTTRIKLTVPQEKFEIFLGIDDAIKIKRENTERAIEKGNLLQSDLRRSIYAYRVTIQNYAENTRKIVVRDHLPLSQHEKIKIKILTLQPQPVQHDKLELLNWEFLLPPGEKQTIDYRFQLEHPQGLNILGLPQ